MQYVRIIQKTMIAMCLLVGAAPAFATAEVDPANAEPLMAIWKVQRVEFNYRSMSVFYSCDGLRNKILGIMEAVGARNSVVDLRCRPGGLTNDAYTLITMVTPIAATPENVTAATTYSSETQLTARLKKIQLPTANDIVQFPVEWREVQLNRVRSLGLAAGDCELLNGLINQVFPHMSLRIAKQRLNCTHGASTSRVRPVLHVAALMPVLAEPMAFAPARQ